MKNKLNFLLGLFAFVAATQASFAQTSCTPNAPTGNAGVFPAPDDIPCIERGVPYDFTMQLENFVTFNHPSYGDITVDWTRIDRIENFPCGISWQSDKSQYAPGETGCIRVSGTSTELAGQYPLRIYITMQVNIPNFGTFTFSDELKYLAAQAGLPNDYNYVSRVIEQGDACPPRDIYSTSVASGEECPVCSAPALPVSSTLPPTASQITVAIGSPDVIVDLNVSVNITHTFIGDLTITLQSPAGTSITLFSGCGGQSDINAIFDDNGGYLTCPPAGNVLPAEALSAFVGESVDGAWTLTVTDNSAGDDGVLNEWCLHPTLGAPPPANDNCADVIPASIAAGDSINFTGSTSGATPDIFLAGISLPAVWEAFTLSSCSDVKISFCGSDPSAESIFSLTYLLTSCPPPMVSLSGQIIYSPACPDFNDYFFPALQPGTYYIAVYDDPAGNPTGMYSVAVSAKDCPPPPPNDNCADVSPAAITNGTPVTLTGTTVGATRSPEEDAFVGYTVVWEAVTLTGSCNKLIVDFCGTAPGIMGVVLSYYSDCPLSTLNYSNVSYITCPDGGSNGMFIFYNLAAGTYYLPVMADVLYNTPGDYTMNVLSIDCMPPPSNDDCSNIVPVTLANGTPVTFTGTTNGVTSSADEAAVLGTAAVWEAVTLTGGCNNLTVDFCGTAGISSATLDVYTDCPLTAYTYGITDFTCPDGNQRFSFSNIPAGTYYLPVPDFLPGDYTMNVLSEDCPPPPANDDCFTAIPVTCGQTVSGSTLLANYDYPGYCGTGNDAPGIWYSFTGTGDLVTLSTCDMADFDTRISVFEGDCSVLNCVGGNEDGYGCGGYTSQFSFISQPGTEYRILIHGYYATGNFDLSVSCTTPPPPPPNDNCADVLPVTLASGVPVTFTGTTVGATASAEEYIGAVVWEAVTLTGTCNNLTFDFCGTEESIESFTSTSIFSDCSLVNSHFGSYDYYTCTDGNISVNFFNLPAGTYYIPVAPTSFGIPGDYTMNVTSVDCPPPPANDDCSNLIPVNVTYGAPVIFNGAADGATMSAYEANYVGYAVVWEAFSLTDSCSDVTVSYCGSFSPTYNVIGRIYLACLQPGYIDAGLIDNTSCGDGNLVYSYFSLPPGNYYIPVMADRNYVFPLGDYSVTVSSVNSGNCPPTAPPPPNDNCSDITPVLVTNGTPVIITGTTLGATKDAFETADLGFRDVWEAFTLTAPCSDVTLSFCGSVSPTFVNYHRIYTSCSDGNYILGELRDDFSCGNGNFINRFLNLPAGTYYVPVFAEPLYLSPLGDYTMEISSVDCPPVPPNDDCASVTPVTLTSGVEVTFAGTTAGATASADEAFHWGSPVPVVWEAVTLTGACNNLSVGFCGTAQLNGISNLIFSACPLTPYIFGNYDYNICPDGKPTLTFSGLPAGTYYLPVQGGASGIIGEYTMTVKSVDCPPPPPNDDCASVTPVEITNGVPFTFTGTSAGASYDNLFGQFSLPLVWEAITLTASCSDVTVSYCGSGANSNVPFYNGFLITSCPAFNAFNGQPDFGICGDGNPAYTFEDVPAGTYYVPIYNDANNNPTGYYSVTVLSVDCPPPPSPPANDDCANAIPISCGQLVSGYTAAASYDNAGFCGTDNSGPGVWYSFTGTGALTTISTCGNTDFDSKITVYEGGCALLNCVAGNDDSYCGLSSELSFAPQSGVEYLILIHGYDVATGNFDLQVTCLLPPANDVVCAAESLPLGTAMPFDNTLATAESGEISPGAGSWLNSCNSADGWCSSDVEAQHSLWYFFTAPASGHTSVSAEGFDAQIAVYSAGDCSDFSSFTELGANDDGNPACLYCPLVELTCLTPGQTYYVQLDGYSYLTGTGSITVNDAGLADVITGYTLVDANTDIDIGPLREGDILNKRLLPPFNVRADVYACGVPAGSVKFVLNGSTVRIENIAPFAIAGDAPAGNYKTWNISPGSYHLETFAYRNRNMNGGLLGLPGEINFTVIDDECYPLTVEINTDLYGEQTSFKLTDRTDNTLVGSIASGTIGSYSAYRQSFCVPADHCYEFKIFDGDGICCSYGSGSYTVTFNREVVASGGEFVSSETASFGSCAPDCEGVIGGSAITDVSGACCQPEDLDCSGVCFGNDNNSLQVVSFTLVDSKTDADIRPLNDGDVVDLSATPFISVRANLCASAGSVRFKVNGSNFNLENIAPYAIAGDAPPGNYKKWNVSPGTYAIEAIPYPGAGGSGTAGVSKTITITVIGGSPKTDDENAALNITEDDGLAIRAYPNPFNDVLTFEFSIPEEGSVILELFRISGEKIATVFEGKAAGGEINRKILNTGLLASGLYLYRLKTSSTVVTERVMLVR